MFGRNVFGLSEMRKLSASSTCSKQSRRRSIRVPRWIPRSPRPRRRRDEGLGGGEGCHALRARLPYPLTSTTARSATASSRPTGGAARSQFAGKTLIRVSPMRRASNGSIRGRDVRGPGLHGGTSPAAWLSSRTRSATRCASRPFISWTGGRSTRRRRLLRFAAGDEQTRPAGARASSGHTEIDTVVSFAGAEQEYFTVDRQRLLRPPRHCQHRAHAVRRGLAQGPGVRRTTTSARSPARCWHPS